MAGSKFSTSPSSHSSKIPLLDHKYLLSINTITTTLNDVANNIAYMCRPPNCVKFKLT